MKIINSKKLRQKISKVISEIDKLTMDGNPESRLIDSSNMSTLQILSRIIEESEERLVGEEMKLLKSEVHKMGVEIVRLKRKTVDL